jgi:hypothetical protein
MGGLRPRGGKMGMSWCRLGDLFKESRMALCVVLGRFGAGDVCQLGYGFILVWRREFMILFLVMRFKKRLRMMLTGDIRRRNF